MAQAKAVTYESTNDDPHLRECVELAQMLIEKVFGEQQGIMQLFATEEGRASPNALVVITNDPAIVIQLSGLVSDLENEQEVRGLLEKGDLKVLYVKDRPAS